MIRKILQWASQTKEVSYWFGWAAITFVVPANWVGWTVLATVNGAVLLSIIFAVKFL